jgi:hypothetical protein
MEADFAEYGIELALLTIQQYTKFENGKPCGFSTPTKKEYGELVAALKYAYEKNAQSYIRLINLEKI